MNFFFQAQARECLFEKLEIQSRDRLDSSVCLDLSQEAAQLSDVYGNVFELINREPVRDYVPYSWVSLVNVKRQHYMALSHSYCAKAILEDELSANTKDILQFIHEPSDCKTQLDIKVPKDDYERKLLGTLLKNYLDRNF